MSFPLTRWTLILTAGEADTPAAAAALAELCQSYWFPVYAFVRRSGARPEDAEDLTQEFFVRFLERRHIAFADKARGRFRSFLLTAVSNFLADEVDRRNTLKRGGRDFAISFDLESAERRYSEALSDRETPERMFEREWVLTLMSRVFEKLRSGYAREGKAEYFDQLQGFLPGREAAANYSDVATRVGSTEGALKVAVHRLRRRYREVFEAEISTLVSDPHLIQDEIQHILQVLRR